MSKTFTWGKDKSRLKTFGKQVFCVDGCGNKYWYLHGKLHRLDGPAVEYANGSKYWYLHGKLHRLDGPAVEYANWNNVWYLNGQRYSESAYWKELKK